MAMGDYSAFADSDKDFFMVDMYMVTAPGEDRQELSHKRKGIPAQTLH